MWTTARFRTARPVRAFSAAVLLLATPVGAHAQSSLAQPAQTYVQGTRDVPLMPGLSPVGGEPLVFDKPSGRIVQAEAAGTVHPDAVRRFYADTLPQLGWTASGTLAWTREGERLTLAVDRGGGRTVVRFTVAPREGR